MRKYNVQDNHSQRKSGPALSEIFSSDVPHSVWDSPTNTPPALNEAFIKVENKSQNAKNLQILACKRYRASSKSIQPVSCNSSP